ncbi:MAG: hypothetical protein KDB53_03725 [Planctomycetes bacterium]|nr:hypothetical protein [Planctomycetota bacterium]
MTAADTTTSSPRVPRRQYLVDRKMQLRIIVSSAGLVAFAGLFCGLAGALLPGDELFGRLSGQEIRSVIVSAIGVFFVMGILIVAAGAMVFTHRVAGPSMVIERALHGMTEGDFKRRLNLRKDDHLKSLAAAATRVSKHLQESQQRQRDLLGEIDRLLDEEDLTAMKSLLESARSADPACTAAPSRGQPVEV